MEHSHDSTKQRPTILVVDDEQFVRRMLARVLDEAGFGVIEAENGEAALSAAHLTDGALSLVVTDLHMPVMSGIEFARRFRPLHPKVPVMFMTGRDPNGIDDSVHFDGCLLRKPFRSEAFLDAVTRLLPEGSESLGQGDSVA
jgi:CheY-like chemotaxis protein